MSPLIHGAAIELAGIDFAYLAFEIDDAGEAITAMRTLDIRGFSVTIPHKESIIEHLDELDVTAERMQSVNTVVNNDGVLKGYSTDGPGAVKALEAGGVNLDGIDVLMIGTGGAARSVCFSLVDAGIKNIKFQAVEMDQKNKLAADLNNVRAGVATDFSTEPGLIINASPIGMHPNTDNVPIDLTQFPSKPAVFDVVYNPLETKFLRTAKELGCVTVDGVGMFSEQAALQFELFTGHDAPRELMNQKVREKLSEG